MCIRDRATSSQFRRAFVRHGSRSTHTFAVHPGSTSDTSGTSDMTRDHRHWPAEIKHPARRRVAQPHKVSTTPEWTPVDGCGQEACPVHDAEDKQWRHLDFFQHEAYLHARLPRVRCHEHGVHQVNVSWARPGSGFTLLFEALLITFATAMPVAKVGEIAREHDTRVWRVIENHVARERAKLDFAEVREVGLDETSAAKGQDYITIFMDLLLRRVLFAIEGRDASTVKA